MNCLPLKKSMKCLPLKKIVDFLLCMTHTMSFGSPCFSEEKLWFSVIHYSQSRSFCEESHGFSTIYNFQKQISFSGKNQKV
jgi:hypothetical protein